MLALTPTAAEAIDAIVADSELPESAGLRISAQHPSTSNGNGPQADLLLDVVSAPDPDDTSVDGTPLYVDSATADLLADKVLDAEMAGSKVEFTLRQQSPDDDG
jgi:Fe-S cluster assembly iron-binding protein IscA